MTYFIYYIWFFTYKVKFSIVFRYEEGHLSGSVPLCLYDICKQASQVLPNKEQTIITYCSSGSRSKEAQEMLETMGYEDVYNLKGGLEEINN